jgi:plasmid stabilization system protein ParE
MRDLKFSPHAEKELDAIFKWIDQVSGSAKIALSVIENLYLVFQNLAKSEFELGTKVSRLQTLKIRMYVHKRFRIYIRYLDNETLEIFTILWGGRNAGRYFESLGKPAKN